MKKALLFPLQVSLCTVAYLYSLTGTVEAQVTPDSSNINTQVNQNGSVAEITGGQTRGGNLFHSFQDFSVGTGNEAFFNNANDISNIFSRVTGSNISNIDGAIRANGSASLFLINPAGIIFGENARLDIGGSFYGTSATSVLFEDGEFSATDLTTPPILTINAPIGLGFRDNPGNINVEGATLAVLSGQSLSLLGGEINLSNSRLSTSQGTVNLGATSSSGIVSFNEDFNLDFGNISLGNISVINGSEVNVISAESGDIKVNALNLTLSDNSLFNAGLNANSSPEAQGGNITVNVSETIALESGSFFRNNLNNNGSGNSGDIVIEAQNLSITSNSDVSTNTNGNGNAGDINLNIADNVVLDGGSRIRSQILSNGQGDGGDININSNSLNLDNSSRLIANIAGQGDAGDININSNSINLDNNSQFLANVGGVGVGGDINVITNTLTLSERSNFSSGIGGIGDGGNIVVNALEDIVLEGSSFFSTRVTETGEGRGGNIEITTTNLSLAGRSKEVRSNVITGSVGVGDAGDIIINASGNITLNPHSTINNKASERSGNSGDTTINADTLILDGRSFILNDNGDPELTVVNNIGNAGNTTINSRIIILDNQSQISNGTFGSAIGEAGDITIDTDSLTVARGSNISSLTENDFDGGEININSGSIDLNTGGTIASLTSSNGNAGNITLNVTDRITIDGDNPFVPAEDLQNTVRSLRDIQPFTGLFANTNVNSSGNGGNIQIANPETLSISNEGIIAVDSQGSGNGGNLSITVGSLDLDNQSQLIAETIFGQPDQQPSNISLNIDNTLTLRGDSLISASARNNANGGNIIIDAEFVIGFSGESTGNDIIASASEGVGGNIDITTEGIFGIKERSQNFGTNDIDASSGVDGLDGTVTITTPDVNPVQGFTQLTDDVIEPNRNVVRVCASQTATRKNELHITGKGGIPNEPGLPLNSYNIYIDSQNTSSTSTIPQPIETIQGKIQPARGVEITELGDVILTAYRTNSTDNRVPKIKRNCN